MIRTVRVSTALVLASAVLLAGCSSMSAPAAPSTAVTEQQTPAADAVTIADAWVKAADDGMSAAFGVLSNGSAAAVTVVSAASPASATLELHETVAGTDGQMAMREVDGGFTIPAAGTLALEPGGNHLMLMDLAAPLLPGDEVSFTLTFSDGSEREFTAPVKDFAGANETYEGHGAHG